MIRCVWCTGELWFDPLRGGWVHAATGKLYVTRIDRDGREVDDHCALPEYS